MIFKRKIYSKMLEWKQQSNGKTALLIKGARRVGKSTIVNITLYNRKPLIIFDEVQVQPLARQAIKHLVADGRYELD